MTDPNRSHITLLVDRSGSMFSIQSDAEGGVNSFISEQKEHPGKATLTLVEFGGGDYHVIHDGDLAKAPTFRLHPGGGTPLYDSMARAIKDTGDKLKALNEKDRPGHVFFVVMTDGGENASREHNLAAVTALVKQQEDQWKWDFVYLAVGPEAFAQSQAFYGTRMVNNTVSTFDPAYAGATYSVASANIGQTRSGVENVNYGAEIKAENADEVAP